MNIVTRIVVAFISGVAALYFVFWFANPSNFSLHFPFWIGSIGSFPLIPSGSEPAGTARRSGDLCRMSTGPKLHPPTCLCHIQHGIDANTAQR
jgi:hypothetical protein